MGEAIHVVVTPTATGARTDVLQHGIDDEDRPLLSYIDDVAQNAGLDRSDKKTGTSLGQRKYKLRYDTTGDGTPDSDVDLAKSAAEQGIHDGSPLELANA